jgi:signal transduction histidine kinase/CheY-like chemotaxis protein
MRDAGEFRSGARWRNGSRMIRVAPIAALAALAVGVTALLGWALDNDAMRLLTPFDEQPRIKANTAFCLSTASLSLLLLCAEPVSRGRRRLAVALAGVVFLVGGLTLAEHVLGVQLGIDQLLFDEESGTAARTPHPGRMASNSALAFVLLGAALLVFDLEWRERRPANVLAGAATALAILALDGLILSADNVPLFSQYANMAFATALAFVLLGAGVVAARRDTGIMRILQEGGPAADAIRRLLPAVLVTPILLGYLRLEGQRYGYFGLEFGIWVLVVGLTIVFGVVIWRLIRQLDRVEQQSREHNRMLVEARQVAERADIAKSEFVSRMSHELRTPLNSILGFGQLLQMDGLRDDQAEPVRHVVGSGKHLLALINEVLDMSKVEAGQLSISTEPVAVDAAVDDAIASITPLTTENGTMLSVSERVPGVFVSADQQRMKQVLLNLFSNAIKYGRGRVHVGASATEDRVVIRVRDNGGRIAEEDLKLMFEPFERLAAERGDQEGTGLGLALTRRLVELMDGTITAESSPGAGTTISVELPRSRAPAEVADEVPSEPDPARAASSFRIVYIEDNAANLGLVDAIVTRHGGEVLPAGNGAMGVSVASAERPDLILLDLHLPDMSGFDVLRELRARPETSGLPIVLLTADASSGTRRKVMDLGADGYLTKPLDLDEFLTTIDDLIVHV